MEKIKVGIVGGAGYTGGELIRILINHPQADIISIFSRSNAGNPVHQVHPDLLGDTDLTFDDNISQQADVIFLCLGHGEARKFLAAENIPATAKLIDLSNDFRLKQSSSFGDRSFVYGLPEINKEAI